MVSTKNSKEGIRARMTLVRNPAFPVRAKDATSTDEEPDEQRNQSSESEPVRVSILSFDSIDVEFVLDIAPKDHVDNPNN